MNIFVIHSPSSSESSPTPSTSSASSDSENISLEKCSNVYVAGYFTHRTIKKFNCSFCKKTLSAENESDLNANDYFLVLKDFGITNFDINYLKRPSQNFIKIFRTILKQFTIYFQKYQAEENVLKKMEGKIKNHINVKFDNWLADKDCENHRQFILKSTITLMLHKTLLWQSEKERGPRISKNRKLNILANK